MAAISGSDRVKLGYEIFGEGPRSWVALHAAGADRGSWRAIEPFVRGRARVLAIDLPGHGESGPIGAEGFLGVLEAIDRLCAGELEGRAALIGHGMGARLALGLALLKPGRWERLVLESGSAGFRRRRERIERRAEDEQLAQALERHGPDALGSPLFARAAEVFELGHPVRADGLAEALRVLGAGAQPSFWPELPRLRQPVLLLGGGLDVQGVASARRMAAELPLCWRKTFEGTGACVHRPLPEAFAREALSFLEAPWTEEQFEPELALGRTA